MAAVDLNDNKRREYEILRSQLMKERSTFLSHWKDLARLANPRRARFAVSDVNRGDRRNREIIHNAAVMALRTLRSGMVAGVTSPARPWFRLSTSKPELNDVAAVKLWLDQVTQEMISIFLKSNLYNTLPIVYGDMGQFATAAMMVEEDFDDVIRTHSFPIGTYAISTNSKGQVDTFLREFRMTVRQVVQKFGRTEGAPNGKKQVDWSRISVTVKEMWEQKQRESWVDIIHIIKPNDDWNQRSALSKYKKFSSVYYERGSTSSDSASYSGPDDCETLLSEKGYDYFPVLCPRWETSSEDAYGTSCPGMDALGDINQLQIGEKRTMQAIDKKINPPMIAPTAMRNAKSSLLPGDITYSDTRDGQQGFRPVFQVEFSIKEMAEKQNEVVGRVDAAYYKNLFLMFADSDRREITAREVDERSQEKLLALGPVLEQLNQDLLDPLIDLTFEIGMRQGKFPPPPKELHGIDLKVEYISIMAQAQKVAGLAGLDRFLNTMQTASQEFPEIKDKLNADKIVEVYGDMTSVPPQIIRPDDEVAKMRQARAQQQQQQAQAEQMNQASQTARNLGQADTSQGSALGALINQSKAGQVVPQ